MADIMSKFENKNTNGYYMTRSQINGVNSNNNISHDFQKETKEVANTKRKDIYAQMPLRLLGYSNELGEAVRPLCPLLANLSWLPAIGYISADIADKYKQDEYGKQDPSKKRASKQLTTQLLASVLLPTCAVKLGQNIVDNAASHTKTGLTLSCREKISNRVLQSMNEGEHKKFLNNDGKIDKESYKESLCGKIDEISKHKKTHKKLLKPLYAMADSVKKVFVKEPEPIKIKEYTSAVADRLIDSRKQLLDGIKPESMSENDFEKFKLNSKNVPIEEKQSLAFNAIKKMEKEKMFGNRILKSIGGLFALSMLAKPIDKFIETVVIDKFVGPAIDNVNINNIRKNQTK